MSDKRSTPENLPAPKSSGPTPSHIHKASKVRALERFAGDAELLRVVRTKVDRATLGKDLRKMTDEAVRYQMKCNIGKCKKMHMTANDLHTKNLASEQSITTQE